MVLREGGLRVFVAADLSARPRLPLPRAARPSPEFPSLLPPACCSRPETCLRPRHLAHGSSNGQKAETMKNIRYAALAGLFLAAACSKDDAKSDGRPPAQRGTAEAARPSGADLQYTPDPDPTPQQIEQGRFATD